MKRLFSSTLIVVIGVACAKPVVRIPLVPLHWGLTEESVRDHFPEVPQTWVVARDCYESELVPEVHEFEFVPGGVRSGRTAVTSVRCLMNSEDDPGAAVCRSSHKSEFVHRSQGRFIRVEGDLDGFDPEAWITRADVYAAGFEESRLEIQRIEVDEDRVLFRLGGCGCYATIEANRPSRSSAIEFKGDPTGFLCF